MTQLAVFRILLGLGMGGEWATGAALVSESFPAKHRGKALAFVQSSWAIGYGFAALVNLIVHADLGMARRVLRRRHSSALHHLDPPQRVEEPKIWRESVQRRIAGASARCSPQAIAQVDLLHHADERMHAIRLVGTQQLGAGLSEPAAGDAAESACPPSDDVLLRHRDAGGDVARLRELRLCRRRDRPQDAPT